MVIFIMERITERLIGNLPPPFLRVSSQWVWNPSLRLFQDESAVCGHVRRWGGGREFARPGSRDRNVTGLSSFNSIQSLSPRASASQRGHDPAGLGGVHVGRKPTKDMVGVEWYLRFCKGTLPA